MFTFSLCVFNGFRISGFSQIMLRFTSILKISIFRMSETVLVSATSGLGVMVDVCEK